LYTLNWLPIGGFVKLEGEDGNATDDPRSFAAQGLPIKLTILVAGVVMNVVLAFAIFTGIAWLASPFVGVRFFEVQPDSPAAAAGSSRRGASSPSTASDTSSSRPDALDRLARTGRRDRRPDASSTRTGPRATCPSRSAGREISADRARSGSRATSRSRPTSRRVRPDDLPTADPDRRRPDRPLDGPHRRGLARS
jgi:hypothetical protein